MCIKRAQPNSYFDPELEVNNEERSFFEVCKSRKKKKNEICAEGRQIECPEQATKTTDHERHTEAGATYRPDGLPRVLT